MHTTPDPSTLATLKAFVDQNPKCCLTHLLERFGTDALDAAEQLRPECTYECDDGGCHYENA